jgi:hypothetical protein
MIINTEFFAGSKFDGVANLPPMPPEDNFLVPNFMLALRQRPHPPSDC